MLTNYNYNVLFYTIKIKMSEQKSLAKKNNDVSAHVLYILYDNRKNFKQKNLSS